MTDPHSSQQYLDEAYQRLHATGPEFEDWLSNHGPMAVEALIRSGHGDGVQRWIDDYLRRLEDYPAAYKAITADNWREALGDPRRLSDWPAWFRRELAEAEWTNVLARWWPTLMTGVAASATHGVIRVGHAVRTLRELGPNSLRLEELAQALGYWAARWQPLVEVTAPAGDLDATMALAQVPAVPDQALGINHRFDQLGHLSQWPRSQAAIRPIHTADQAPDFLKEVVSAAVGRYVTHGHGSGVMLVHAATAPNAVLRTLPSLPVEQWKSSAAAAWTASAAVQAAYAPATAAPSDVLPPVPSGADVVGDVVDRAVWHGDEHVIKFADTARDVYDWTGDGLALAAATRATQLIG